MAIVEVLASNFNVANLGSYLEMISNFSNKNNFYFIYLTWDPEFDTWY